MKMVDFCPECDCAVGLHTEEGCQCMDDEGHPDSLETTDGQTYCSCTRTETDLLAATGV